MNQANVAFVESTTRPGNNGASGPTEYDERLSPLALLLKACDCAKPLGIGLLVLGALCALCWGLYAAGKLPIEVIYALLGVLGVINLLAGVSVLVINYK